MKLNDRVYEILKWVCVICIPALTTCASVILDVWHLASPEVINAIITTSSAVATLIGALIGISTAQYNKDNKGKV